ncbi:MAG: hypothetical protein ACXQS8_04620, partial [Candidatus Helarchaeales archaeon]
GILNGEQIKLEIEHFLEFLVRECIKERIDIKLYDESLWEIVKKWRIYFIKYMNIIKPFIEPRRKVVQLPKETRKIIEDSFKKMFEKKIK